MVKENQIHMEDVIAHQGGGPTTSQETPRPTRWILHIRDWFARQEGHCLCFRHGRWGCFFRNHCFRRNSFVLHNQTVSFFQIIESELYVCNSFRNTGRSPKYETIDEVALRFRPISDEEAEQLWKEQFEGWEKI